MPISWSFHRSTANKRISLNPSIFLVGKLRPEIRVLHSRPQTRAMIDQLAQTTRMDAVERPERMCSRRDTLSKS